MALSKIGEVRSLSDEALNDEVFAVKRKLFELRLQLATRRLEKNHEFKHAKHRLAQLLTIERERQLNAEATSTSEEE